MKKLSPRFYADAVLTVARKLVGCFLVRELAEGRIVGRINEVEAYDGAIDKACHAFGDRRTARNEPLFRNGGIAHVYLIYGRYYCLNAVTGKESAPAAVLLRGIEVLESLDMATGNRYGKSPAELTKQQRKNLTNGPGKLCCALAIDRLFDLEPLDGDRLYICEQIGGRRKSVSTIRESVRIGIDYAEEAKLFPWRFTG
jgi:DNA-3-methyladenine glycosylase (3mg)